MELTPELELFFRFSESSLSIYADGRHNPVFIAISENSCEKSIDNSFEYDGHRWMIAHRMVSGAWMLNSFFFIQISPEDKKVISEPNKLAVMRFEQSRGRLYAFIEYENLK